MLTSNWLLSLLGTAFAFVLWIGFGIYSDRRKLKPKKRMLYYFDIGYRSKGQVYRGSGTSYDADTLIDLIAVMVPDARIFLLKQNGEYGFVEDKPEKTSFCTFKNSPLG